MKRIGIAATLCAATLLALPNGAWADDDDPLTVAIKAETTLDELAAKVVDLRAMADLATYDKVRKTLAESIAQWPAETDASEKYRPCKTMLERASHVAELTRTKATASLDDKAWMLERSKMTRSRAACAQAVHLGGIKTA